PAGCIRLAEAIADELDAGDLALLAEDLDRAGEELHPDAFALGLSELLLRDDQLRAGPPIDDRDAVGAMAQARPRAVHGGVATTDHDHVGLALDRRAGVGLL